MILFCIINYIIKPDLGIFLKFSFPNVIHFKYIFLTLFLACASQAYNILVDNKWQMMTKIPVKLFSNTHWNLSLQNRHTNHEALNQPSLLTMNFYLAFLDISMNERWSNYNTASSTEGKTCHNIIISNSMLNVMNSKIWYAFKIWKSNNNCLNKKDIFLYELFQNSLSQNSLRFNDYWIRFKKKIYWFLLLVDSIFSLTTNFNILSHSKSILINRW